MKKFAPILIPIATALLLVTGCSDKQVAPASPNQNHTSQNQPAQNQTQQPAQKPTHSQEQPPTSSATPSKPAETPKLAVKEGTGEYTGMIDGNSVEIIVNGEPMAFRLTEGSKPMVEKLKRKARVSFHYTEAEQIVLQDIQKLK